MASKLDRSSRAPAPEGLRRAPRAFGHRFELRPANRRMPDPGAEPAIGAGQDILAADEIGITPQPTGNEGGVLDEIGAMADNAGDQRRPLGELDVFEHAPFVLVTRVRGLY